MNRREFIGCLGSAAGAWLISGCASMRRASRVEPNIILIMADDVGYEAFGCYGGVSYQTPVIDGLARSGVMFTQCHSQPLCTPSRVKLMTGKSNIRNYTHFSILDPGERTFAHMLRDAGYATAVAGKWQLYGTDKYDELAGTGTLPEQAGFEEYCLWQIDRLGSRYWDPLIEQNGRTLENLSGRYGPDVFCDFILDFVERKRERPFFVYYPMALVHSPFDPTPDSEDRASKDKASNFADMTAYMDKIVGRIKDGLEDLGLREDTLLLFTSDNGTNRKITSRKGDREVKGGKGLTIDAGTHVPLVASWPGHAPEGFVCDDLIDFSDFLPTLAQAGGADISGGEILDGQSFFPQILGRPGRPRDWIFCYYHPRPERENIEEEFFARDRRWKLYGDGRLFDLEKDPMEEEPLRPLEEMEIRQKLQGVIDSFIERNHEG